METDNPFEKVLDRLREKGWYKGYFWPRERVNASRTGPYCIVGATQEINFPETLAESVILSEYPSRVRDGFRIVTTFNDHPDTTFSDVERVLEKAAVKWEEERVVRDD